MIFFLFQILREINFDNFKIIQFITFRGSEFGFWWDVAFSKAEIYQNEKIHSLKNDIFRTSRFSKIDFT